MNYLMIVIAGLGLFGFYHIGELDRTIGNPLGTIIGISVIVASFLLPGGLFLYSMLGLALLYFYKDENSNL